MERESRVRFWAQHIEGWKSSGLSQRRYCECEGIAVSTLQWWCRRLRENGRGDTPNQHDILTGSDSHGRALIGSAATTTCNNWTSNGTGSAIVGHHDRSGGGNSSWNAAHASRGCSQENLQASGGAGLFYCFAAN